MKYRHADADLDDLKRDVLEMRQERYRQDSVRRAELHALRVAKLVSSLRPRQVGRRSSVTPAGVLALIGATFGAIFMTAALMMQPEPPKTITKVPIATSGFDTRPRSPIRGRQ